MKKYLIAYALSGLICSLTAQAQKKFTLSGYISDARNGEKMPFVNVLATNADVGAITNEYGFYSLSLSPGAYEISISFLGYTNQVKKISLNANRTLNIEMEETSNQLNEVLVSGTRGERVNNTEMGVDKLDVKTLKQIPVVFGEPDVIRSLTLLPGVTTVSEAASGFNVRGGSADQNLVLLDEAIVYNTSHAFGFFSVFNSDAVKEYTLYKGGVEAKYGGRISSVLDVRQKEGNNKKFSGAGSIGTLAARVTAEGPMGRKDSTGSASGSWMVAARRSYADLFLKTGIAGDNLKDATLFFYDLNVKTNYTLNRNNKVFLSGYFGRDRFKYPGFFGTAWGNGTGTLRWNHLFNSKLFLNTTVSYSNYDYELTNYEASNGYDWNSNIINWNTKLDFSWFVSPANTLSFGTSALRYKFEPGKITPTGNSSVNPQTFQEKYGWEFGTYISNEQKIGERVVLTYGLRYAEFLREGPEGIRQYANNQPVVYNPATGFYEDGVVTGIKPYDGDIQFFRKLEPRFSARMSLNENQSVKVGYNRINQFIHLISNTTSATPLDIWTPSGSYLNPQQGDQYAIGYFSDLKEGQYELSIEGYYKDMKNLPDYIDGANLLFNDYPETEIVAGDGYAYGAEILLKKQTGRITGWISYTYSRSLRTIPGINQGKEYASNSDKPHQFNLTSTYKLSKRWTLSANFVIASGAPITYPSGKHAYDGFIVPAYTTRNQHRLPAYHRLDVSATLQGNKNGKWIFGVYNAYNRLNPSTIYFREKVIVNDQGINNTGKTQAVKFGFFGIIPSVSYEFTF